MGQGRLGLCWTGDVDTALCKTIYSIYQLWPGIPLLLTFPTECVTKKRVKDADAVGSDALAKQSTVASLNTSARDKHSQHDISARDKHSQHDT